ncbi:hypothetical protein NGTWS0302_03850 [Mycolicibacterium cyprinidarum]|uniref:FUSC family protein n=1 Tax=Mycolicibacterium cyprinidarum TaxID=2860311 RepID=A0ABQ4V2R7_9MYCO|nr:hypothetical protein NGTWS1702_01410 [Mycolicibacterium sp. NGTWSNA01]GJF13257.1 hypothetical protein NGTWS0302_03850 [Mycolicibacterium sp. NGTWS0302]
MTGSDDSHSNTRPISVAELLAKNGSIGAPPLGGRRRRRRGNSDAVTVAELTGEIPIIRSTDLDPSSDTAAEDEQAAEADAEVAGDVDDIAGPGEVAADGEDDVAEVAETEVAEVAEDKVTEVAETEDAVAEDTEDEVAEDTVDENAGVSDGDDVDDYADAVAEYAATLEHRGADADPVDSASSPRRFGFGRPSGKKSKKSKKSKNSKDSTDSEKSAVADAEQMSPDPTEDGDGSDLDLLDSPADLAASLDTEDLDDDEIAPDAEDSEELPSYLRSTQEPLFGGQTVADDLARRGALAAPEEIDLGDLEDLHDEEDAGDAEYEEYVEPSRMSSFVQGLWIVGQSIIAVVLGAGLFIAFDQLWRWNNIVALALSVLVILGLVVAVRVVRKTEDIGSTLIAVAVGALVTLGPLALLQSG